MTRHLAWVCLAGLTCGPAAAAADRPAPPAALTRAATAEDAPQDLALAAACLERGEETAAVAYLTRHVAAHPNQPLVRAYLAELLWRRDRLADAKVHYERFLDDAQVASLDPARQIHAHTRLMAIAQHDADAYAEHLHRGIGLYLIARQSADDPAAAEGLLCKAAGELTLAQRAHPDLARPHWYLHLVWSRLGLSQSAARSLGRAAEAADLGDLSPAERRDLALAAADRPRGR
jgi:tetratricopeptide (TPR) repeat protein